jgi:hypothetical protein
VQKHDEHRGARIRCHLVYERLGHQLAHLGLVAGILSGPAVGAEDAEAPAPLGAEYPARGKPLAQRLPQVLAQRPDHGGRLVALVRDQDRQGRVEDGITGREGSPTMMRPDLPSSLGLTGPPS